MPPPPSSRQSTDRTPPSGDGDSGEAEAEGVPGRPTGPPRRCDVLVVGAGPSGAAAAYWLADAGLDVVMVEKKAFPRDKTCGDGLTPRAVRQLEDMGLKAELADQHHFVGLRALAFGRELELTWPRHPDYPDQGVVITRSRLDGLVAARAEEIGAELWRHSEAVRPLGDGTGGAGGAVVRRLDDGGVEEVRARYVVVADGANSRFGRSLGAARDRSYPLGMAIRGYFTSPRHAESFIESHLDIRDAEGNVLPGYGWIFPLGDGRVNVGVGLLSTSGRWKGINTSKLYDDFVAYAPTSWCLSEETSCGPPTGGRLPMGLSVGPTTGPDYLLVGDAAGAINPFNGEGIAYGYETGRLAASVIAEAIAKGTGGLGAYEEELRRRYRSYYDVAAKFMTVMGHPKIMRTLVATGMRSKPVMDWLLRLMSNMCIDNEHGPAELTYATLNGLVKASRTDSPLGRLSRRIVQAADR